MPAATVAVMLGLSVGVLVIVGVIAESVVVMAEATVAVMSGVAVGVLVKVGVNVAVGATAVKRESIPATMVA
jgi:hypothetical protein